MNNRPAVVLDSNSDTLVFHVARAGYADFVKGLLGQPQTIENLYFGAFDISKNDIESVFHLVHQRVAQQNKAHLIQFSINIFYSDDTSVLINSLEVFQTHREIPPRTSVAANLSWIYLIQFEDRPHPERQVIELTISTGSTGKMFEMEIISRSMRSFRRSFKLTIQHTARTWATDIENLLAHQIRSWIITEPWIKRTIYENSGWVGLIAGLLFLGLTATGLVLASNSLDHGIQQTMGQALTQNIDGKLDYLMHAILEIRIKGPQTLLAVGSLVSIILSTFVGIAVSILADNPQNSYLIISENAAAKRLKSLSQRRRGWQYFLFSGVTATIAAFLSKYLFLLIVGKSVI